jgi:hypothetical protein
LGNINDDDLLRRKLIEFFKWSWEGFLIVSWGRGAAFLGAVRENEDEDDDRGDNNDDNDLYLNRIPTNRLVKKISA